MKLNILFKKMRDRKTSTTQNKKMIYTNWIQNIDKNTQQPHY